jgi:hypothetical protein
MGRNLVVPFLFLVFYVIRAIVDGVDCGHYGFTGTLVALDKADISEQYSENLHKIIAVSLLIEKK